MADPPTKVTNLRPIVRFPPLAVLLLAAAKGDAVPAASHSAPHLEPLWVAEGFSAPEGAAEAPGGGWLVSAWRGDIFYVAPDGGTTKLLDTREAGILQNDLSVFGEVFIVPNWMPGTVTAWRIVH